MVRNDFTPLGRRVVEAVAGAAGSDPLSLPPLHRVVDADALEALYAHADASEASVPTVWFTYADHFVVVRSTAEIEVRGPEAGFEE
jgi:hypothetical protein